MEDRLRDYRAKRRRQEIIDEAKSKVKNFFAAGVNANEETMEHTTVEAEREPMLSSAPPPAPAFPSGRRHVELSSDEDAWEAEEDEHSRDGIMSRRIKRATTVLLALVWFTVLLVSYQLGLALAFCMISSIFLIYMCTRTRPRKPGEPSAYSVFNPNCQSIDGSLNAEQFERELRFGPTSVR